MRNRHIILFVLFILGLFILGLFVLFILGLFAAMLVACFVLDAGVPESECPRHGGPVGSDDTCPCTPEEDVIY